MKKVIAVILISLFISSTAYSVDGYPIKRETFETLISKYDNMRATSREITDELVKSERISNEQFEDLVTIVTNFGYESDRIESILYMITMEYAHGEKKQYNKAAISAILKYAETAIGSKSVEGEQSWVNAYQAKTPDPFTFKYLERISENWVAVIGVYLEVIKELESTLARL